MNMPRPGFGSRAIVLTGLLLIANNAVAQDAPTLSDIIERLHDWRQSFTSIRVVADLAENEHFPPSREELNWAVDKEALSLRTTESETGLSTARGKGGGLSLCGIFSGQWLDERLQLSVDTESTFYDIEALVIGFEDVDGHSCVRVDITDRPTAEGRGLSIQTSRTSYWLDVEHDYLPRKWQTSTPSSDDAWVANRTWTVDEFHRVEGIGWFPWRGRHLFEDSPPAQEWSVASLTEDIEYSVTESAHRDVTPHPSGASSRSRNPHQRSPLRTTLAWMASPWVLGGLLLLMVAVVVILWRHVASGDRRRSPD